jgi:hypothetical protein
MAVKKPIVGELAFRGNIRRAFPKFIESIKSMVTWQRQRPDWPVQLWTQRQIAALIGFASSAEAARIARVPAPPKT